jgi:polysaccharide pyruvyl transferase WcaK-like protein
MRHPSGPPISYLGWHGRGNLGDDAMYDAVRAQFPAARLLDVGHLPRERLRDFATGRNRRARRSHLMIGGGTCLGRSNWRGLVSRVMSPSGAQQRYAIGVGVEDPGFGGYRSHSGAQELDKWVPILGQFDAVSVRGPRSAELLSDAGFDVTVSGDPALLLPRPDTRPTDGLIGVNIGFGDDLWGHDPDTVVAETSRAVKQLVSQGHKVVGILMNPDDESFTRRALHGTDAPVLSPATAADVASVLASCSVAIVTRLHAAILAALSGTPVVAFEYQPKCRDFAMSIGDEMSLIRTDVVSATAIVDLVDAACSDSEGIRRRKLHAVAALKDRLESDYAGARTRLGVAQ